MAELYLIEGPEQKRYIGVTSRDARHRFYTHCSDAKRGRCGSNSPLYNAMRKYGQEAFSYRTLVVGDWDYVLGIEDAAIKSFGTMSPAGYNAKTGGHGGAVVGEARERLIAANQRNAARPGEHKRLQRIIADAWADPEFRERMKSRPVATGAGREKIKAGARQFMATVGQSEEYRSKMSERISQQWLDPVWRAKRNAAHLQRKADKAAAKLLIGGDNSSQ